MPLLAQVFILVVLVCAAALAAWTARGLRERQDGARDDVRTVVSASGARGLVDDLIAAEVVLGLLSSRYPPTESCRDWAGWDQWPREDPLGWLCGSAGAVDPAHLHDDPRLLAAGPQTAFASWDQQVIVDQAARRLLRAMRDWAPLLGASEDGRTVQVILAHAHQDLLRLQEQYAAATTVEDPEPPEDLRPAVYDLRWRLRVLAVCFQQWSGSTQLQPPVLADARGLTPREPVFGETSPALERRLAAAKATVVSGGRPSPTRPYAAGARGRRPDLRRTIRRR